MGSGKHARRGVDGDAAGLSIAHLDLARVDSGADLDAKRPQRLDDCGRAGDRLGGPVERGEKSIAGSVDFAAAKSLQLRSHGAVMGRDEVAPSSVTEADGQLSRADDVGEQNGGKDTLGRDAAAHAAKCRGSVN